MPFEDRIERAVDNAINENIRNAVPKTMLWDKLSEECEHLGWIGENQNIGIYRWEDGKNTLYAFHNQTCGVTFAWLTPKSTKELMETLQDEFDQVEGESAE